MSEPLKPVDFIDDLARPSDGAMTPDCRSYVGRLEHFIRVQEAINTDLSERLAKLVKDEN